MIIQKIQTQRYTIYKKDNTKIDIDTFYNIRDSWEWSGYIVKSYTMKRGNAEIITYYVNKNI